MIGEIQPTFGEAGLKTEVLGGEARRSGVTSFDHCRFWPLCERYRLKHTSYTICKSWATKTQRGQDISQTPQRQCQKTAQSTSSPSNPASIQAQAKSSHKSPIKTKSSPPLRNPSRLDPQATPPGRRSPSEPRLASLPPDRNRNRIQRSSSSSFHPLLAAARRRSNRAHHSSNRHSLRPIRQTGS
jgi:hypothetical protein